MEHDYLQFYPTPLKLAMRLSGMFKKRPIIRLLEPSAGNGDLLNGLYLEHDEVDLIEVDVSRHELLRTKGTVVGTDFLESKDLSMYSHILMNPPFRNGVKHVLHAWKHLFSGEISAILNASSVDHPKTLDECRLCALIDEYGRVEYAEDAFISPETLRKTRVKVALVYLEKKPSDDFWEKGIFESLKKDDTEFDEKNQDMPGQGLALGGAQVQALVRAFDAAWEARKRSLIAEEKSLRFDEFFQTQVQQIVGQNEMYLEREFKPLQERLSESYKQLKRAAWISVLNTAELRKYLSCKVTQSVLNDFEPVRALAFTESNIYGFMQGFAMQQGHFQKQMVLDLFDLIVSRYSDNCIFYKSWKSNERHQVGMALRRRRFILGGFSLEGWRSDIGYTNVNRLKEIDKVFALMDGKNEAEYGIDTLFANRLRDLRNGMRLSTTYFEIRFYPGIGTIHFFPKDQRLIDRINLLVGKARSWIPEPYTEEDMDNYRSAEKVSDLAAKKLTRSMFHNMSENEEEIIGIIEDAEEKTGESSSLFSADNRLEKAS